MGRHDSSQKTLRLSGFRVCARNDGKAVTQYEKNDMLYNVKTMKTLDEIREILKDNKDALKEQFGVSQLGLFGSFVRGEQNPESDLDILVDFDEPVGLFKFMDLNDQLEELTGMKVDLVTRGALKPYIGKRILSEVSYL